MHSSRLGSAPGVVEESQLVYLCLYVFAVVSLKKQKNSFYLSLMNVFLCLCFFKPTPFISLLRLSAALFFFLFPIPLLSLSLQSSPIFFPSLSLSLSHLVMFILLAVVPSVINHQRCPLSRPHWSSDSRYTTNHRRASLSALAFFLFFFFFCCSSVSYCSLCGLYFLIKPFSTPVKYQPGTF